MKWQLLLYPFHRWENHSSEKQSDLVEVTGKGFKLRSICHWGCCLQCPLLPCIFAHVPNWCQHWTLLGLTTYWLNQQRDKCFRPSQWDSRLGYRDSISFFFNLYSPRLTAPLNQLATDIFKTLGFIAHTLCARDWVQRSVCFNLPTVLWGGYRYSWAQVREGGCLAQPVRGGLWSEPRPPATRFYCRSWPVSMASLPWGWGRLGKRKRGLPG